MMSPSRHYLYIHPHSFHSAQTELNQRCITILLNAACHRHFLLVPSLRQLNFVSFYSSPHFVLLFPAIEPPFTAIDSCR